MQRYFFDVINGARTEYDFKGREFDDLKKAIHYGELIALDVAFSSDKQEHPRREVKVQDVAGTQLYVIAIRPDLELVAA